MQAKQRREPVASARPARRAATQQSPAIHAKIPVGDQPICAESAILQIDPVWFYRRVPAGFWDEPRNRRNYLLWLGHKLHFRYVKDWYRLTYKDMASHRGGGVANVFWYSSPAYAVKECFPQYQWQEWLFVQVPTDFWRRQRNRRRYMTWLGKQLGFRKWQDWYRVTTKDFQDHRGSAFLLDHRSSVSATVMACYPEREWKEWLFSRVQTRRWEDRKTCQRYLKWLGKQLGYRHLDDWYRVTVLDFKKNGGDMLLRKCGGSASAAVIDLIPRHEWCEWRFSRVPNGFWDNQENRRRYVLWLGERLGCHCQEDWRQVRTGDFKNNHAGALLNKYHSLRDLLEECFPQWNWNTYRKQPLTVEQILDWADAYFSEHGRWPNVNSGVVAGTEERWALIFMNLFRGDRGLPSGMSLSSLLNQRRGAEKRSAIPKRRTPE